MDSLEFCAIKRWPNLLQLVQIRPPSSEAGLRPFIDAAPPLRQMGPCAGDDTHLRSGIHTLGPCVGDDFEKCDARLKEVISRVGTTAYGLPLYQFRYRGQTEVYEGVMAQDVLKVMPSAVCCAADGTYRVNLRQLGVELRRVS